MSSGTTTAPKGLEGVVATNSSICYIDDDRGILCSDNRTSQPALIGYRRSCSAYAQTEILV